MIAQRGFTLLEVMVATSILAVGLTAVCGGFSLTARSTALSAGYERARLVAETEMARFLASGPERPSRANGRANGVSWRLRAEPDDEQPGLLRVSIDAQFFAAGERSLLLETLDVERTLQDIEGAEADANTSTKSNANNNTAPAPASPATTTAADS